MIWWISLIGLLFLVYVIYIRAKRIAHQAARRGVIVMPHGDVSAEEVGKALVGLPQIAVEDVPGFPVGGLHPSDEGGISEIRKFRESLAYRAMFEYQADPKLCIEINKLEVELVTLKKQVMLYEERPLR